MDRLSTHNHDLWGTLYSVDDLIEIADITYSEYLGVVNEYKFSITFIPYKSIDGDSYLYIRWLTDTSTKKFIELFKDKFPQEILAFFQIE